MVGPKFFKNNEFLLNRDNKSFLKSNVSYIGSFAHSNVLVRKGNLILTRKQVDLVNIKSQV